MIYEVLEWVQFVLTVGLLVVMIGGSITDAREKQELRDEIDLLHERMDRVPGMPDRLPVHVITSLPAVPTPPAEPDADDTDTTVMPVVGRHRRPVPHPRTEVATYAAVVGVNE